MTIQIVSPVGQLHPTRLTQVMLGGPVKGSPRPEEAASLRVSGSGSHAAGGGYLPPGVGR